MSIYFTQRRQTILASTHGYRSNQVAKTVVGAFEYVIQAPIMAAKAMMSSAPLVTSVEAAQANIPTGYTADTPVLYAGPPKPQFQYAGRPVATAHFGQKAYKLDAQFPFVSKIEEPCRSEILSILHQALDSIPRGKVAPWNVSKEFSGMRWWANAIQDLYSSKKWISCIQTLTWNPDRIGARTEIVNTINEIRLQCISTIAKGEICVADSAYLPSVY